MSDEKNFETGEITSAVVTVERFERSAKETNKTLDEMSDAIDDQSERLNVLYEILHENIVLEREIREKAIDAERKERLLSETAMTERFIFVDDEINNILDIIDIRKESDAVHLRNETMLLIGLVIVMIWNILLTAGVI